MHITKIHPIKNRVAVQRSRDLTRDFDLRTIEIHSMNLSSEPMLTKIKSQHTGSTSQVEQRKIRGFRKGLAHHSVDRIGPYLPVNVTLKKPRRKSRSNARSHLLVTRLKHRRSEHPGLVRTTTPDTTAELRIIQRAIHRIL